MIRIILRLLRVDPCPPCKLGIDGKLSDRCLVGCRRAMKEGLPK